MNHVTQFGKKPLSPHDTMTFVQPNFSIVPMNIVYACSPDMVMNDNGMIKHHLVDNTDFGMELTENVLKSQDDLRTCAGGISAVKIVMILAMEVNNNQSEQVIAGEMTIHIHLAMTLVGSIAPNVASLDVSFVGTASKNFPEGSRKSAGVID